MTDAIIRAAKFETMQELYMVLEAWYRMPCDLILDRVTDAARKHYGLQHRSSRYAEYLARCLRQNLIDRA